MKKTKGAKRQIKPRDLSAAKDARGGAPCTTPRPGGPTPIPYPN
jgi:hypothetical protein